MGRVLGSQTPHSGLIMTGGFIENDFHRGKY